MSGAGSTLIAAGSLLALFGWLWLAMHLRPRHPQHAARYRVELDEPTLAPGKQTLDYLPVFGETIAYAVVEGKPPWDLEEEASARAAYGELVFGDSRGWQSGGCLDEDTLRQELAVANAVPVANRIIDVLRELESSGPLGRGTPDGDPGLPASGTELGHHNGPAAPPGGPAGAGHERGAPRPVAPPAPVSWLECQLEDLFAWVRSQYQPEEES